MVALSGRDPRLDDAAWLDEQFALGRSAAEIGDEVGVTGRSVRNAAYRVGVVLPRARRHIERRALLDDDEWLRAQREARVSPSAIADFTHATTAEVVAALERHGLSTRSHLPTVVDEEKVRELVESGLAVREVARRLGLKRDAVRRATQRLGIKSAYRPGYYKAVDPADVDVDELRRLMVDGGLTPSRAAKQMDITVRVARLIANREGFVVKRQPPMYPRLRDEKWVRAQFDAGRSITEVAELAGAPYDRVTAARRRFGITTPRRIPADELRRLVEAGESNQTIAAALGVRSASIRRAMRREGIQREGFEGQRPPRTYPLLLDENWVRAQFDAGRTITEVAELAGAPYHGVIVARRRFGIAPPQRRIPIDELRRRVAGGESNQTIAAALGFRIGSIRRAITREGIQRPAPRISSCGQRPSLCSSENPETPSPARE